MAKLFSPLTIKSIQLKNRIVISPMCQYSAVDGFANDWHLVHLGSRAVGGAGLIITEACAVSPEGRISPYDIGIWKDEHITELKRITSFIISQGSVPAIQLAHAGRKASCAQPWKGGEMIAEADGGWQTLAPSPIPFNEKYTMPVALSKEGIQQLVSCFQAAAKRSLEAGFKILEIHAAHGYLIHEFFSVLSNHRTDEYGGSFENRIRFLCEILTAIQKVWPENLPIFVRISASDWVEGGWDLNDSIQLAFKLKEMGVDLMDCSSGGNISHVRIPLSPGYQVHFSKKIKAETGIQTGTVGLITGAEQAENILANEDADLVFFARESLRNPYFPLTAAAALEEQINWPIQYERAKL